MEENHNRTELPQALMPFRTRAVVAAVVLAVCGIGAAIYTGSWTPLVALLGSAYFAHLALSVGWRYASGRIRAVDAVCVSSYSSKALNAVRHTKLATVVFKPISSGDSQTEALTFRNVSPKDVGVFTVGTIYTIYYDEVDKSTLFGWDVAKQNIL